MPGSIETCPDLWLEEVPTCYTHTHARDGRRPRVSQTEAGQTLAQLS